MKSVKSIAKQSIKWLADVASKNPSKTLKNALYVFCYHDVTDNPSEFSRDHDLFVTVDEFRQQIEFMGEVFDLFDPKEMIGSSLRRKDKPLALITFDDGYKSYFDHALPILNRLHVPSINFLNGALIETNDLFWSGVLSFLFFKEKKFFANLEMQEQRPLNFLDVIGFPRKRLQPLIARYISENSLDEQIRNYSPVFAKVEDVQKSSESKGCFLGNHLHNHFSEISLSGEELKDQYFKNEKFLKQFKNYFSAFSFPFGQPNTTYRAEAISAIKGFGSKVIFSAFNFPNRSLDQSIYYRIGASRKHVDRVELVYSAKMVPKINQIRGYVKFKHDSSSIH